jgi:hypothetical protein
MPNATAAFLTSPWRIELDDVHGLWGGERCIVWSDGRVWAEAVSPARDARQGEARAPAEAVSLLRQTLVATDFITIALPPRPGVPDEACPVITLTNAAGERRPVRKWAGDRHAGFEAVQARLHALAAAALGLSP